MRMHMRDDGMNILGWKSEGEEVLSLLFDCIWILGGRWIIPSYEIDTILFTYHIH
jgi:hypothetical protein